MSEQETKTMERVTADAMNELRTAGLSNGQIGERLGCSRWLVHKKIGAQPEGTRKNKHVPKERKTKTPGAVVTKESMLELRAGGMTNPQIADELGVSRQYVHRVIGPGEVSHGQEA